MDYNHDYSMNLDPHQMDLNHASTANSYYNRQAGAPSSSQHSYSNTFWGRKPQSQNAAQVTFTPLTTAGSFTNNNDGELDNLKMQLKIKESQIDTLESDIQRLNESMKMNSTTSGGSTIPKKVPSSLNEVFVELSLKYYKTLEELESTKLRLESLVTAMTLNPSNNVTNNGRYDELETSNKILIKLENLKRENEELMKQLSFGKVKQMEIEMSLLKKECANERSTNEELQRENQQLKKKLDALTK